jgi:hypothetical protein
MEGTRPAPVDRSQFADGRNAVQVVEAIGALTVSVRNGDQSCGVYKLYTRNPGGVARGVIAAGDATADGGVHHRFHRTEGAALGMR